MNAIKIERNASVSMFIVMLGADILVCVKYECTSDGDIHVSYEDIRRAEVALDVLHVVSPDLGGLDALEHFVFRRVWNGERLWL